MTIQSSKDYKQDHNVAPHPAAFAEVYTPSDTAVFTKASRWFMITDTTAKIVNLRLGGATQALPAVVAGVGGDITITAGTGVLSSSTANKFQNLAIGDAVNLSGFVNGGNNGNFVVTAKADNQHLTLGQTGQISGGAPQTTVIPPKLVTETPTGALAVVKGLTPRSTQETVSFTALPGVMYPICADQLLATTTTAASVICFR